MKKARLSFDFSDTPHVAEMLRIVAAQEKTTQKAIVIRALESFFASKMENRLLMKAAEHVFRDWDNKEDKVYDEL